jgi:translation initiation factor 1
VTIVSGFQKISSPELEDLVSELQRACAAGGTLKKGRIEIQGNRCDVVMDLLVKKGFRPVRTGG